MDTMPSAGQHSSEQWACFVGSMAGDTLLEKRGLLMPEQLQQWEQLGLQWSSFSRAGVTSAGMLSFSVGQPLGARLCTEIGMATELWTPKAARVLEKSMWLHTWSQCG